MQELKPPTSPTPRSLRAVAGVRAGSSAGKTGGVQRMRRGRLDGVDAVWRRCAMGTNHIACFGIWRRGTRRQAERLNRAGSTRWHMPHRGGVRMLLPGAVRDAAGQD